MARYVRNAAKPEPVPPADEDFGKRIGGHAQQLIDEELSQRLGRGALEMARFADALRSAGSRLEGSRTGPYFNSAAGQIEHAAELLRNANARDIVDGVERFARQSPLMFVGGAIALGIGAGRFLKSSAPQTSNNSAAQTSSTPALPSSTTTARRSARRTNQQDSQTRGNEP